MARTQKGTLISGSVLKKMLKARVARLATAGRGGVPHLVPICFVFDGQFFYSAVDRKPKRAEGRMLQRIRNIAQHDAVALLVDHYAEDWRSLWYVLVRGRARLISNSRNKERAHAIGLLRKKYRQYTTAMLPADAPVIRIKPERWTVWSGR